MRLYFFTFRCFFFDVVVYEFLFCHIITAAPFLKPRTRFLVLLLAKWEFFFPVLLPLVKTIFPFFFASKNHSKLLEVSNEHLKNKKEIWRTKWNYKKDKEQRGFLVCYQAFLTIRILWTNKKYDTFNGLMKNLSFAWSCWACLCCCAYESYSFHN